MTQAERFAAMRYQDGFEAGLRECAKLRKVNQRLLAAAKAVFGLIETGMLVRDISHDHEDGWAIRQLPLEDGWRQLKQSIEAAEGTI